MVVLKWLCSNNSKNKLVKIVHPGGHKELHERTLLAREIMNRNPKCVVAYHDVFRQPWNVVEPDTMLMLGHKYYVVPTRTVRKLQRHFLRNFPSLLQYVESSGVENKNKIKGKKFSSCLDWIWARKEDEKCLFCMFNGLKTKANNYSAGLKKSSSRSLTASDDHWQPGLESIREELSQSNNNLIRENLK